MHEKRRTAPDSQYSFAGARTSVSARWAPIQKRSSNGLTLNVTGSRSPSPTERRPVNTIRVIVGEGGVRAKEPHPWGQTDLVCPSNGPPTEIHSPTGPKTSVPEARTSVSARCAPNGKCPFP
jgi:hypothetical protein